MRGVLSVRRAGTIALFVLLLTGNSVSYLFAADDSGKQILCPTATYKGTLELALDNNANPVLFEDMFFIHGGKAEKINSSNGNITLKSIMICEQNDKSVAFTVKHVGTCMLSGQENCQITLDGTGAVKDNKLAETGKARLRCPDNATRQGTYSIRAADT
jgi:hypothetical protein